MEQRELEILISISIIGMLVAWNLLLFYVFVKVIDILLLTNILNLLYLN